MKLVVKALTKVIAICVAAVFLARYLVGSGLVRSGLDTSFGDAVYTYLREFFNVNGSEDAETLVVFVVLGASIFFVAVSACLLSKIFSRIQKN
ncbi:hypothetical protein [Pseudomonas syringae group genomosp. 3]|uniref:Uncharacterized protein n=1 Tax=Pseudomonas syringae pv. primulae TaxID=251707 RepID=A0A3M5U6L1_9PSED|nr:hypothetical protein [Pseudomonas syringae group genomosp. 3]RMO70447.1 hypothetical protein ALQ36_200064 [Pseudomonas syringae pv. primulae]RMU40847.1 hypothetical protein ALP30_200073 [Pseudomonas syringae pv. primulae]